MGHHALVHVSDLSTSKCGLHWPPFGKPESKNKCYWSTLSPKPDFFLLIFFDWTGWLVMFEIIFHWSAWPASSWRSSIRVAAVLVLFFSFLFPWHWCLYPISSISTVRQGVSLCEGLLGKRVRFVSFFFLCLLCLGLLPKPSCIYLALGVFGGLACVFNIYLFFRTLFILLFFHLGNSASLYEFLWIEIFFWFHLPWSYLIWPDRTVFHCY